MLTYMNFKSWLLLNENIIVKKDDIMFLNFVEDQQLRLELENQDYDVYVRGSFSDQPLLEIDKVGSIRLLMAGPISRPTYYTVHSINGKSKGAGTILYFAALEFVVKYGIRSANGLLASDTTISSDAVRARKRIQDNYGKYISIHQHPDINHAKTHNWTDERFKATPEEASMWKLKTLGHPFNFNFISANPQIKINT